jgi:hypothetical protein
MDRDNRYISRVIQSADSRVRRSSRRRFDLSLRQALYYNNDRPDAIMEDFDQTEYGAVLHELERHVLEWSANRRPTGRVGRAGAAPDHLSTGAAAKAIVDLLRPSPVGRPVEQDILI